GVTKSVDAREGEMRSHDVREFQNDITRITTRSRKSRSRRSPAVRSEHVRATPVAQSRLPGSAPARCRHEARSGPVCLPPRNRPPEDEGFLQLPPAPHPLV